MSSCIRFALFLVLVVCLAAVAAATQSSSNANETKPVAKKRPPLPVKGLLFVETFDEPEGEGDQELDASMRDAINLGRWIKSEDDKYGNQPISIRPTRHLLPGFEDDRGLVLNMDMKRYAVSTRFPQAVTMEPGQELVVQYEVRFEESLSCGGAYIKLLRDGNKQFFDPREMNDKTPYSIMFGPDKCGSANNKIHFIVQYKNPRTKKWSENHYNESQPVRGDKRVHLYTLHLKADNNFVLYVDKRKVKEGNLLTHMTPSIIPPREIDDPKDIKPEDWVDEELMADPEAKKPDDWDEDAPALIVDPRSVKPEGWLDNGPEMIPDPKARKPSGWDDEEDGEWQAPMIPNPVCQSIGCGEWKPSTMKNPAYKGKWKPPLIPNPAFKGVWKARQILNPSYFEEKSPVSHLAPMVGLAVEVWTTNGGILFDNFIIARKLEDAFAFADKSFTLKSDAEREQDRIDKLESRLKEIQTKLNSGNSFEVIEGRIAQIMDFFNDNMLLSLVGLLVVAIVIAKLMGTKPVKELEQHQQNTSASNTNTTQESKKDK